MPAIPTIIPFQQCDSYSYEIVGEKGINLGKLTGAKFPIPPGFIVPSTVFETVLQHNVLKPKILELLDQIDFTQPESIHRIAKNIQAYIKNAEIPEDIAMQLLRAYHSLGENVFVAVRSSKTTRKEPHQHATFFNIQGDANTIESIKNVWANTFSPQRIQYRNNHGVDPVNVHIAVTVQTMIQSQTSGIIYSTDPVSHNKSLIRIQTLWGIVEDISNRTKEIDEYVIEKNTWEIIEEKLQKQTQERKRKLGTTKLHKVPQSRRNKKKLSNEHIKKLAQLAIKIQHFSFFPQEIEWAIENDSIYLLQTQQITHVPKNSTLPELLQKKQKLKPLVYGSPTHSGLVSGQARVVTHKHHIHSITNNEIVITENIKILPKEKINIISGLVLDNSVSHAEVKNFGIPVVSDTHVATSLLKTGQHITLHGQQGVVYSGTLHHEETSHIQTFSKNIQSQENPKLYISTGEPHIAKELKDMSIDGVGLFRTEYIIAKMGVHPKKLIREKKQKLFVHELVTGIEQIARTLKKQPIIVRTLDFTANEFLSLQFGNEYEEKEENPVLGYRGAFRYITDHDVFNAQLEAIAQLHKKGYTNIELMIPFIRTIDEWVLIQNHTESYFARKKVQVKKWMMVDTPSNVLQISRFLSRNVDGLAIGTRDLSMLLTGYDISNPDVAAHYYQKDPIIENMVEYIIEKGREYKVPVMICEHTLSRSLIEKLIQWKINAISVNKSQIEFVQQCIHDFTQTKK